MALTMGAHCSELVIIPVRLLPLSAHSRCLKEIISYYDLQPAYQIGTLRLDKSQSLFSA
jgi:hypothetical protein